tara:strand:+ start:392 stop:898 length:507 start_codon:yes stop_codon:yes gene_type:complete
MELTIEQRIENRKKLEEKLKKIEFSTGGLRVIDMDLKNYESKDQRQLSKLIFKYETAVKNIRKNKFKSTEVRDYKLQKTIRGGFQDCMDEGFNGQEIKNKWIIVIENKLKPVKEFYEKQKLENTEKQLLFSKEKLTCDICAGIFSRVNKARHITSKAHLEAVKELTPS